MIFVVHGRKFRQRWGRRFNDYRTAVWLLDEPYEVDDTVLTSALFDAVFVNDPSTLQRHKNSNYLPVAYDPHVHTEVSKKKRYDVGFIGGFNPVREKYLLSLLDAGLLSYVVGGPWTSPKLKSICLSGNIPSSETTRLYQQTRIVLNVFRERHHFNRQNIPAHSLNPRIYEALACGALVVSEWRPELAEVFPYLPTFKTSGELIDTINELLHNHEHTNQLLSRCRQDLAKHTYANRLKVVLDISLDRLNSNKESRIEIMNNSTIAVKQLPIAKHEKAELPNGWFASNGLMFEGFNDNLVISALLEKDFKGEAGFISEMSPTQLELSFEVKLEMDTRFIAKILWQDRNDGESNSYHLISTPEFCYIAKHHQVFKQIPIRRGCWQSINLRRTEHTLLELRINGVVAARINDNQLQSGYCFLGVGYGKATLRNIRLLDLSQYDDKPLSSKPSGLNRTDRSRQTGYQVKTLPFTEMPVRNLIYHIWPVKGSIWRWNLDQLIKRMEIFNGRRIIGIVHDDRSVSPEEVKDALEGHGCEFFVQPNNELGEVITFPKMMKEVASQNPNELTFYSHAKGVKYESDVSEAITRWVETQYHVSLDNWLMVKEHMEHFALTGPFRMLGRFRTHHNSGDWHYSGTNFWIRHAFVFSKGMLEVPSFYGGVEAWPGIHFKQAETGCLFMDQLRQLPYHQSFWSSKADAALSVWELQRRVVQPPADLVKPMPFQGYFQPSVEQKPEELEWWISTLLESNTRHLLTIGAMNGGVEWHIARVFREHGKDIDITTVDINPNNQAKLSFAEAQLNFGQKMRLIAGDSASQEVKQQLSSQYDSVFIDGDHTYRGACSDWMLAKSLQAKLIGFHDIVDSDWHIQCQCGVSRLWSEIKKDYQTDERTSGVWGGIGIVSL
ncbi:MAG: glycosyltransferase [Methylococcaceae bacterium]|nr:glycosyltransferase [Methylococcaceae bacterium]